MQLDACEWSTKHSKHGHFRSTKKLKFFPGLIGFFSSSETRFCHHQFIVTRTSRIPSLFALWLTDKFVAHVASFHCNDVNVCVIHQAKVDWATTPDFQPGPTHYEPKCYYNYYYVCFFFKKKRVAWYEVDDESLFCITRQLFVFCQYLQ